MPLGRCKFTLNVRKATKERTERIENENKEREIATLKTKEYKEYLLNLIDLKVLEVLPKIKELISEKTIFENRKENNEIINRVVGFIGYEFVKQLGWNYVVDKIVEKY